MKNTFKCFGIIVLAVLLAFSIIACGDDDSGGSNDCKCANPCTITNCSCDDCPSDGGGGCNDCGVCEDCDPNIGCGDCGVCEDCEDDDGCECADPCTIAECDCDDCPGNDDGCEHIFSTISATCTTNSIPGICTQEGCNEPNPEAVVPALGHNWNWVITTSPDFGTNTAGLETKTCKSCVETDGTRAYPILALGDTGPAGGIIFYVDPAGFRLYQGTHNTLAQDTYTTAYYLEAWTADETGTYIWSWVNEPETSPYQYTVVSLVQQSHFTSDPTRWVGYGLRNTRLIVTALNSNGESGRAAQVASTAKGEYNDWFLPSVDELNAMHIARMAPNNIAGLPTTGWFWTSSQFNDSNAQMRDNSSRFYGSKHIARNVRAVRAF